MEARVSAVEECKRAGFFGLVCLCSLMVFGDAIAQGLPRACSPTEGGGLAEGDKGVHAAGNVFNDGVGRSLPFTALSLSGETPNSVRFVNGDEVADLCMRYEIRNDGVDIAIEALEWPAIGLPYYGLPIPPGEQNAGWVRRANGVLRTTGIYAGPITALRNSSTVMVNTQLPERRAPVDLSQAAQAIPVELVTALADADFDVAPLQVVRASEEHLVHAPLTFQMALDGDRSVSVESTLAANADKLTYGYQVDVPESVSVFAPMLSVLEESRPLAELEDALLAIARFSELRLAEESDGDGFNFEIVNPIRSAFGEQIAFISDIPVTIRVDDAEICVVGQIYSPVPLSGTRLQCVVPEDVTERWRSAAR
jgi:hypothetical protein